MVAYALSTAATLAYAQSVSTDSVKSTSSPETEKLQESISGIANLYVASVTGGQIPRDLEKIAGKDNVIVFEVKPKHQPMATRSSSIRVLPKVRIISTFEPHLRRAAVKRLRSLVDDFRHSIGNPEAAVLKQELRIALTDVYKESVGAADTRNFATAISMVQDFLRPHWSQLSSDKLAGVSEKLGWLADQNKLEPRLLDKFYVDLVAVLKNRISFETVEGEPDEEQE